jgi:hypothetical protein
MEPVYLFLMMACCDENNDDDGDDNHYNYRLIVAVLSFGKDITPTNQNITIVKNVGNNNRLKNGVGPIGNTIFVLFDDDVIADAAAFVVERCC